MLSSCAVKLAHQLRPLQKGIFLLPALLRIRKCSFTIEYAAFAAELKNKNLRFLHAVSSYAKLSNYYINLSKKDLCTEYY